MTCLGVLERGERDNGNKPSLKEGGVIKMSTKMLPLRDARSIHLPFVRKDAFNIGGSPKPSKV